MRFILFLLAIPYLSFAQIQVGDDIQGEIQDFSGTSLSFSESGTFLIIGSPSSNASFGRARIFENSNNTWVQVGEDIIGEADGDRFANQVAISADGSIVAASSPFNDGFANNAGHVRIFENINGIWTQIGDDIDGEDQNDLSGNAISLSADGNIIAIGARSNDGPNDSSSTTGHVRVFENQNGVWTQIGQDIDGVVVPLSNNNTNQFGDSVSLSSDGSIVAVGAPSNNAGGENAGRVRIFENQNGTWTQIGNDIRGNELDRLGESVSLSADGTIVAIGAPFSDNGTQNSGTVSVFEFQNNTWEQVGQNINGQSIDLEIGSRVSLSSQGDMVAIGIPNKDSNTGETLIYENDNGTWTQVGIPIVGEQIGDFSGAAISLAGNGEFVALGEPFNEDNGTDAGKVRVFNFEEILNTSDFDTSEITLIINNQERFIRVFLDNSTTTLDQVNLYNINGQFLFSSKENTISTEVLSSGVYIVETQTSRGISAQKIVLRE